jgi:hypothetical protein
LKLKREVVLVRERIASGNLDALGKPKMMRTCPDEFEEVGLSRAIRANYANEGCLGVEVKFDVCEVPPVIDLDVSNSHLVPQDQLTAFA